MSEPIKFSRRTVIKTLAGSVVLTVHTLPLFSAESSKLDPEISWSGNPGRANWRIEGLAKVTGKKIFARDYRARDCPGWPADENVAMVLRAIHSKFPFEGINLSMLPPELQPLQIVDASLIQQDHITIPNESPEGWSKGLFVQTGDIPSYLGQPIAILIFKDYSTWRAAKKLIQFNPEVVTYGAISQLTPLSTPYSPQTFITRYLSNGTEMFSQVLSGESNPYENSPVDIEAAQYRNLISEDIERNDWRVFKNRVSIQRLDPMFMEPESGMAWLESSEQKLHLLLGTQSTNGDISHALNLFSDRACSIKVSEVDLISCYPGGGFGGRDESPFSALLIIAAAYSDGPVRIAHDRFEQFQSGLKRMGSSVSQELAIDSSGKFQAIKSHYVFEAGGRKNYSPYIAELGAYSAGGAYNIPRVGIDSEAMPTNGVTAGSMRGFGGPTACFALETLIDEAAIVLNTDPIVLRLNNALAGSDRTVTGAPISPPINIPEICNRALRNPLWINRATPRNSTGQRYGVGFAMSNQAFGTGNDGVMARVNLTPDGDIVVSTNCVDMGNGSATSLAISTAGYLGKNATAVNMGDVAAFETLSKNLHTHITTQTKTVQKLHTVALDTNDDDWNNPNYTASFSSSSSACLTAFHQVHAVTQACAVLYLTSIFSTARRIWGIENEASASSGDAQWIDGFLTFADKQPLSLESIVQAIYQSGGITEVMVHAYFGGHWVQADYTLDNGRFRFPIDGLAIRHANTENFDFIPRENTLAPPEHADRYGRSLYAPSATIAAVYVHQQSGKITVSDIYTYLDAGKVIQPDLLAGQYHGAVAMGIGSALLEYLPVGDGGPGEGNWNLDRYLVANMNDVPVNSLELELLPPVSEDATGKGIAEAVLCPIAPAIINAIAAATGYRSNSLPVSIAELKEALRRNG